MMNGSYTDTGSALLNSSGTRAVWMLFLALVFKMVTTIFTYGIKVMPTDVLKYIYLISLKKLFHSSFFNDIDKCLADLKKKPFYHLTQL